MATLTLLFAAATETSASPKFPNTWTAVAVGGDVTLRGAAPNRFSESIRPGQVFGAKPGLVTGEDGRLAMLAADDVVVLDPMTNVELERTARGELRASQRSGGAFYSTNVSSKRTVAIQTPDCRIDATGGALLVSAQRGYTTVHLRSGAAQVRFAAMKLLPLSAGDVLLVRSGHRPRVLRSGGDPVRAFGRRWARRVARQHERFVRMSDETNHVRSVVSASRRVRSAAAARPAPPARRFAPTVSADSERVVHPLSQAEFAKQFMSPFYEESLPEIERGR